MRVIEASIEHPVTTAVGVILLTLFGLLALARIPVQLTPSVEEPAISVITEWPGASPHEIEREIIDEQEEQLKSLEGLVRMESLSSDSRAEITLTFRTGSDLDAATLKVSNRLQQVPSYPADAERPVIKEVSSEARPIAWFVVMPRQHDGERPATAPEPFDGDISSLYDFIDNEIKPEFERVRGVAASEIFGGRRREVHVLVDPAKLAARQVTMGELVDAIDRENRNLSGGDFNEGKRRYVVRTVGEYATPADIEEVVIAIRGGVPVHLGDVATAELAYSKISTLGFLKGKPMIGINAQRQVGANVLDVMADLKQVAARLDSELLAPRGLRLHHVYDETEYIDSAITLVRQSLIVGGFLAVIILLLFLRSTTSTLIVAAAIPISIIGTFLMMSWFGRTLNVISLAGMAFATGMVVDSSIVVLENIYRHRQLGKSRIQAALIGTREVWGAVLASTLTTIAVFVPVLFVREEAGQLFRDIAIAISCAVGLSLLVAITVIPALSAKILRVRSPSDDSHGRNFANLWGGARLADRLAMAITDTVSWLCTTTTRRLAVVIGLAGGAVALSLLLVPKADYLPVGNQNFLLGLLLPPPGYNIEEVSSLQKPYLEQLEHLWNAPAAETEALPGGGLRTLFFIARPEMSFVVARARDPLRVGELIPVFRQVSSELPGTLALIRQASLFESGIGKGRHIDVDLTGPDLEALLEIGSDVYERLTTLIPGMQPPQPLPSLDLGNPELRVVPHRRRAAEMGLDSRDIGLVVSALVDGIKASDYRLDGREIDLKVMAELGEAHRTHLLEQMPIATPDGQLVTLGSVADLELSSGPTQIRRIERQRAVTLRLNPPATLPLQTVMEQIETEVLEPLRQAGILGTLYRARLAGAADKLTETGRALALNLLLAVIITYLLMTALFEDFFYPLVIMTSVPLAALGGFLGLALLNATIGYQSLDVLTMLGFIILVGTVVNNAILIVHQTLNLWRSGKRSAHAAIREATRSRIRPIFMSVFTSVFGMLPLVLFPGAGSELYRGLGSVVVGGLAVSTVFTLFLIPALLSLVLEVRGSLSRRFGSSTSTLASEPLDVAEPAAFAE